MRAIFVILIIGFSLSLAYGQNNFLTTFGDQDLNLPLSVKKIGENYYIATASCDGPLMPGNKASMVKMNKFGEKVAEKVFVTGADQYYPIRKIYPLNETEFLLLGGYRENDTSNSAIWIIKMDTMLNVLWEKKYPTEKKYVERICYTTNNLGNIVLGATLCTDPPSLNFSVFSLEITLAGDFVRSKHETTANPSYASIYSIISNNEGYYAFVDGFASYMPEPITSPTQRLELDLDFNIMNVVTLPMGIYKYLTAKKVDEKTHYLSGCIYVTDYYTEIGIQKINTSNTLLTSNHFGVPGEYPDEPGWHESMALNSINNIFAGGTGYAGTSFTQCNLAYPKVFILSNYDSLLNCRWTRYYGSDTACYSLMAMDATSDGGCILAGTILAPASPENQIDIIIIKVDSLGLITSTNKPGTRPMQALIYPNPGNDYLMLQTGPQNVGVVFTLMNIQSQKLIEIPITTTTQQIPTHTIPSGVYTWSLSRGNARIETGKWIKQ